MKKKRVPGFLYNDIEYRYPNGLSITSEVEYDAMLNSGDWLEGPGEPSGESVKPEEDKKGAGPGSFVPGYYEFNKDDLEEWAEAEYGLNLDKRKSLETLQVEVDEHVAGLPGE